MSIFGIFKRSSRSSKINLKFTKSIEGETKEMRKQRIEISTEFQNILNRINDVRNNDNLTPEQKYGVMMGSLYMINQISTEMIDNGIFFTKDKQFEKIHEQVNNSLKKDIPNYIG